jgi:uncharacterized protein
MAKTIIGMVHLLPLLGSTTYTSLEDIISQGRADITALQAGGINAIMLENDGDSPYSEFLDLPQATCLAIVCQELAKDIKVPFGYTVLLNDWKTALSLAKLTGADFIRLDTYVDTVKRISDGTVITPDPKAIQAFRKSIQAENIKIYTDVHVKHTEMVNTKTLETSITEAVAAGSDGIIITGSWTGQEPVIDDLAVAKKVVTGVPLIVGSGINAQNINQLMSYAEIAIVGSSIKTSGKVDAAKVKELMQSAV